LNERSRHVEGYSEGWEPFQEKTGQAARGAGPASGWEGERNDGPTVQLTLHINDPLAGVSGAIESLAGEAGLLIMKSLIDEEVEQLAGQRSKHDQGDKAVRWGSEESYVLLGGKKVR